MGQRNSLARWQLEEAQQSMLQLQTRRHFLKESAIRTRFDLADTRIEAVIPETSDRVRVMVNTETHPPRLPVGRVTAEDIWVRVSGHWYKVHENARPPFPGNR